MEFAFNCESLLGCDAHGIAIVDSNMLRNKKCNPQIMHIIDIFGELSAKSQALKAVITTGLKLLSSEHRLYILAKENTVIGILKVGPKELFIRNELGQIFEINPLCCLDFYIYEKIQRAGYGKFIFDEMLRNESIHPSKMGYDRPSPKLIGFLSKHYGLVNYIPQNNNYVVFKDYFKGPTHSVGERPLSKAGKEMLSNNYQSKHELITQSYINKLCQVKSLSVKQVGAPPHKMPPKPAAVHTQDQSSRIDKTYFKEDIIAPIWKYKKAPWGLYMNNQYTNKTASSEIGSFLKSTYGSKK